MKFLQNIIKYILIVFFIGSVNNYFFEYYVTRNFNLDFKKKYFVFGDSHAECSFTENFNLQSFGVRSEVPNLTLIKSKFLFDEITSKSAILTIGYHNISKNHENRFFKDDTSASVLGKYWNIINLNEFREDYSNLPIKTKCIFYLKKFFGSPSLESSFKLKKTFKGGFYNGKDTTLISKSDAKIAYERHFGSENLIKNESSEKLKKQYRDLLSFLNSKTKELILINTPLHKNYRDHLTADQINNYIEFIENLQNEYPELIFLDYSKINLQDSLFLNSDHLNKSGAIFFSNQLLYDISI